MKLEWVETHGRVNLTRKQLHGLHTVGLGKGGGTWWERDCMKKINNIQSKPPAYQ